MKTNFGTEYITTFDWINQGKRLFGYLDEVIIDTDKLRVFRYHTEAMVFNGVKVMNPLVKFEKTPKGAWNVYFLDPDFEEYDFPIFNKHGHIAFINKEGAK